MKLAITGGGSGGHTLPAVTIYDSFVEFFCGRDDEKFECIYIGSHNGIEKEVANQKGILYFSISTGKLRRYFSITNFTDIFRTLKGIVDSYRVLRRFKPDVIFSTGGFVSIPVVIASKLLSISVVIHEQTSSVGLANKIASYFAQKVAITFPSSNVYFPAHKVIHTGQPIRKKLLSGTLEKCYHIFQLDKSVPILYVTGGSQGSHKINLTVKEIIPQLIDKCNIIHQCGKTEGHNDFEDLTQYKCSIPKDLQHRYVVKDFIQEDELKEVLGGCSLLVGRAGAGTVSEAMALKIPSIFIPLAIATKNEQFYNAKMMESIGGAEIIEESFLTPELLKEAILSITVDSEKRNKMQQNLKAVSTDDAADKILHLILDTAKKC